MAVLFFFADPHTFYDCYSFLCSLQFVLCCNSMSKTRAAGRFVTNKWTTLYSYGCGTFLIAGQCYSIYVKLTDPHQKPYVQMFDKLLLAIIFLELFLSTIMFTVTVTSAQWYSQRQVALLDRINALDQRLISEFGVNMNYHKLMRKNIIISIILVSAYLSAVFSSVSSLSYDDHWLVLLGVFCYMFSTSGPHLCGLVHINFTEVLTIRFRLMQRILNREYLLRLFPNETLRESRLRSAVEIVQAYHQLIREINTVYMLCLLTTLMHDMTLTTSELYAFFGLSDFKRPALGLMYFLSVCLIVPFYKMLVAPIYCQKSIAEGTKCLDVIEQIEVWFPHSKNVHNLVASLCTWRLAQKFQYITGVNIVFNKTMTTMIVSWMVSFMLILIQFRTTQDMHHKLEKETIQFHKWFGINSEAKEGAQING